MTKRLITTRTNQHRSSSGQAIVEGAVALILIIAGTVGGTLLLVNSGMAAYYKEKLAIITANAANYAASLPTSSQTADHVKPYVDDTLRLLGIKSSSDEVVVDNTQQVGGKSVVTVTVKAHGLPLVGNVFGTLDMQDTGVNSSSGGSTLGGLNVVGTAYIYKYQTEPARGTLTHVTRNNSDAYLIPLLAESRSAPEPKGVIYSGANCLGRVMSFQTENSAVDTYNTSPIHPDKIGYPPQPNNYTGN